MKQHKWHKEIIAWANGYEIEIRFGTDRWFVDIAPDWSNEVDEYRVKPQPHKHQELMDAHKNGAIIQMQLLDGGWMVVENPNWLDHYVYRVRPQTNTTLYAWLNKSDGSIHLDEEVPGFIKEDKEYKYLGKLEVDPND